MYFNNKLGRSTLVALLTGSLLASASAFAGGLSLSALLSEGEIRELLTRPGSQEMIARLLGHSQSESEKEMFDRLSSRLDRPELLSTREEIEARLNKIHERYKREMQNASERDRKLWLSSAANHLQVSPEWRPSLIEGGEKFDFFAPSPVENYENARTAFMKEAADPALKASTEEVPLAERPAARKKFEFDMAKMKECVANRPPSEKSKFNYKYLLTQLGTDEIMTLGGAIVAAGGIDNVDWKTIPNDLAFEAFASAGESLISGMSNPVSVPLLKSKVDIRWYVMQGFGMAQSSLDAVIYSVSKSSDHVSTKKRFMYNTAWNGPGAWANIKLYDIISGMECLDAPPAMVLGTQVAGSLGLNVLYFGLRNGTIGKNND